MPSILYTVGLHSSPQRPAAVLRWTLDTPAAGQVLALRDGRLAVQGWLLMQPSPGSDAVTSVPAQLIWRVLGDAAAQQQQPFNCGRPDVIDRVLGELPAGHPQLLCGFTAQLSLPGGANVQRLELGFQLPDGESFWPLRIELQAVAQVIEGADGQLFLDNDTNRSVDQYTGVLLLNPAALRQWRGILADCRALARRMRNRHAMVIAPAKEEVLRMAYPHVRAGVTVLDQVLALARPDDGVIDGARVLADQLDPAAGFKCTDTHWTDRGAMWVTLAALAELGYDIEIARACLSADVYHLKDYAGDLGVKLLPPRSAPTEFLDGPQPEAGALFDNLLPNMGRVLVFENLQAAFDERLLMFGASSAYPMLKYLKRLFRRVVFVHSAGHVDVSVVEHERPHALLLQSTGRFLVQPPEMNFSLADAVAAKLADAPELRRHAAGLLAAGPWQAADSPYLAMLGERHRYV